MLGTLGENQFAKVVQRSPRERPLAEVEQNIHGEIPLADLDHRAPGECPLADVDHRAPGESPLAVAGREAGCAISPQSLCLQSKDSPAHQVRPPRHSKHSLITFLALTQVKCCFHSDSCQMQCMLI